MARGDDFDMHVLLVMLTMLHVELKRYERQRRVHVSINGALNVPVFIRTVLLT